MISLVPVLALIAAAFLPLSPSAAAVPFREGTYSDGGITVTVRARPNLEDDVRPWYEIEARGTRDGKVEFGRFYYDPQWTEASASPIRNGRREFVCVGAEGGGRGLTKAQFYSGGPWAPQYTYVALTADGVTGALLSLHWHQRIARFNLPNGWHSGPFKRTFSKFKCDNLLAL